MNWSPSHIIRNIRHTYDGGISPERDWNMVLLGALILLIVSAGINAVMFIEVYNGEPLSGDEYRSSQNRDIDTIAERLKKIEMQFEARTNTRDEYLKGDKVFIDPARN